jgi:Dolichyl-phosphate-mannose-protein mannosyltransferase
VTDRTTVRDLVTGRPVALPPARRTESVPPAAGTAGWLPEAVPVAVAGFGIPAMALLLLGRFQVPLVVLAGTAGAVAAVWVLGPQRLVSHRYGRPRWTAAALLLAAAFFGFNAWFATEDLYAMRDPSTYVATGQWLAHHPALPVDTEDAVFRAPTQAKLYGYSAGFGDDNRPGHVAAQGNHLLPALLAVVSRYGGEATMLRLNALVGAAALLAMFGLVRRFAGDPFALVATAALAVSLPMLEFSRDAYTEPLALLLLFGGLSVLWRAVESGRLAEFALAGLTAGATVMSRIDAYLPLLALVAVGVGYAGRAPAGQRAAALRRLLVLVGCLVLPAVLGYLDVARLSPVYYRHNRPAILIAIALLAVALAGGALLVAVCWRVRRSRLVVAGPPRAWAARLAVLAVPAFFAGLLSRPLWLTSYQVPLPDQGGCYATVVMLQQEAGLPVQPCRSYDELTAYWFTWHFGWPALVLAVAGLTLLAFHTMRDADLRLLGVTAVTVAMCLVYLVRSSITPDQVWAMRRYLPVVLPGLLGAAGYLLSRLWEWQRPGAPRWVGPWVRRAAVGLAVLLVAVPAFITHPMELVRQDAGQLGRVHALCRAVGASGAVLAVAETAAAPYLQTVRSTCQVPAHGLGVAPEPDRATFRSDLVAVRQAALAHGHPLYVITEEPALLTWAGAGTPDPFSTLSMQRWPGRLDSVPQQPQGAELQLWAGLVLPDGTVRPLPDQAR